MQISALQQELLRQTSQSSDLYMTIFRPRTVMSCQVDGSIALDSRTIPYTSVSTGSYLAVEPGMTLLVGTTQGGRELGKIRIKDVDASEFTVAENSDINWPSAQYLTVQRYFELWPIYPRIVPNPSNDEDVIFYKDYDIAYTNQNSILGSFVCMGGHKAGFSGDSFYWSASGTTQLLGSALSYEWAFEGGDVTGSTLATPGWVQYNSPGDYVTRLTVTAANGSVDTSYRYVSIRNEPYSSSDYQPIKNWQMTNLSGDRNQGGYSASFIIQNEAVDVYDGDVVIIWKNDWYADTNTSIGGNSENNSSIFFVGHVMDGSIHYNWRDSTIEFQVGSVSDLMRKSEGFSVSVESKPSPSKWFHLLDMDGRRAIYHYLRWHTTVLSIADFQFIGNDKKVQFFDSDRESMYDAVDNYMRGALVGQLVADRQGKLWAEVEAMAYSNPTGSFPPVMEISSRDWMNEPDITVRNISPTSYLEMGGIAYSGTTTGTFTAHIGAAPGETPSIRGSVERIQGLTLEGQNQLNELVGNVYANKVCKYPSINIPLSGNYSNFDIAPQETVDTIILASENPSGISIHAPYVVSGMGWDYNGGRLFATLSLSALVNGRSGKTITIPDVPDEAGYGDYEGFNFNPVGFPPLLSTLGNRVSGAWQGTYVANSSLATQFILGAADFNYGFTQAARAPVTGVYIVSVTTKADIGQPGTAFTMPGYFNDIFVGAAATTHTTMVYAPANTLLVPRCLASGLEETGTFSLYIALLYQA